MEEPQTAQRAPISRGSLAVLGIVVGLAIGLTTGGGGVYLYDQSSQYKQLQDASQQLLTKTLHKLAAVSDDKALKVTDTALSAALKTLSDVFENASTNTGVSIAAGDRYLCDQRQKTAQFSNAGYGANYTTICADFDNLASSGLSQFAKVIGDLEWALVELDNTIAKDP